MVGYEDSIPNVFQVSSSELVAVLADWHSRCPAVAERKRATDIEADPGGKQGRGGKPARS
jgi:hypothetical protein